MVDKRLLCPISSNNSVLGSIPAAGPQNEICVVAVSSVMLMNTLQTQQSDSSNNKHINPFRTFCAFNNVNISV